VFTPEELRALADLLRNNFTTSALPPERQQELLLKGIIASLEELVMSNEVMGDEAYGASSPITLLYQTAARHPIQGVRGQAFQVLIRLAKEGNTPAIDALYRLAIEESLLSARQRILTLGWQPGRITLRALFDWFTLLGTGKAYPEEQIPLLTQGYFEEASPDLQRRLLVTAPQIGMENWARIIAAVQDGAEQPLLELVERYPSFRPAERAIALEQLDRLAKMDADTSNASAAVARNVLSLLYIRHEDPGARQLILSRGYLPDDPEQRALFFFLAEAWQPYETLDFDHHLLVSAYEAAGRSLRRRLLEHSRHTGQLDWLRGMGSGGADSAVEVRWLEDLTDADWDLAIRRLSENEKDVDLWRLAQFAPPMWSAAILDRLAKRGWQPGPEEERRGFTRLVELARESLASPLAIHPLKTLYVPPISEVTCLAMHPSGRTLAAGRNDQYILQWDLSTGDLLPTQLIGPAPVTRALAYSPDGEMLASASGDNRIRVFRLKNAQILKTFEGHQAMIRALAIHPDGRAMYSAGFDGSIRFWRFPHGAELKTLRPGPDEIFSLAMSANGSHLISGGADCLLHVWTLPEGVAAREMIGHTDTITHLAASPSSELVASSGREGFIRLWNFTSGGQIRVIENTAGPLTALCMHPNDQVLIGGHSKGAITLWSLSTGRVIDQLNGHRLPITGLVLSTDGSALYSADSGGRLYAWDLRAFLIIRLPGEVARPGASASLKDRLKEPHLSTSEKKWLNFSAELAHWRQRFDIELGEIQMIQVGEFDIEL
jgi:WD40 repeat protein